MIEALQAESSPPEGWPARISFHPSLWVGDAMLNATFARVRDADRRLWHAGHAACPLSTLCQAPRLRQRSYAELLARYGSAHRMSPRGRFAVLASQGAGLGLFAIAALRQGHAVGAYAGRLRVFDGADPGEVAALANDYWFQYHPYRTDLVMVVDAQACGNHTRFINHAANANTDLLYLWSEGLWRGVLIASRDIAAGEEVTLDYGEDYWCLRGAAPRPLGTGVGLSHCSRGSAQ